MKHITCVSRAPRMASEAKAQPFDLQFVIDVVTALMNLKIGKSQLT